MESSASNDFGRDHGLMHEVVLTSRRAGWGRDDWSKLAHNKNLMEQIRFVLQGTAKIERAEHVIRPRSPAAPEDRSLNVDEHLSLQAFVWKINRVVLHQFPEQATEQGLQSRTVREALLQLSSLGLVMFNATVLEYLLENQHLIPEDWKGEVQVGINKAPKRIFFWGTTYYKPSMSLGPVYVWYLQWIENSWHSDTLWVGSQGNEGNTLRESDFAAMLRV